MSESNNGQQKIPYPSEQSDKYPDILNKYEFVEHNALAKRNYLYQEPVQMLMRNYISLPTTYTSILLYHGLGAGKTCNSITIAEGLKEYIANMGKRVVVLVKNKNIQKNFINELASQCTGDEYITEEQRDLFFSVDVPDYLEESKKGIVNRFQKLVNKTYNFMTYGTFVNRVLGAKQYEKDEYGRNTTKLVYTKDGQVYRKLSGSEITEFNNTVVIVDEAHNVTNNDTYTALHKVLSNSYNYRLVLLTATPMYDNVKEMFELANLLNANDRDLQLPIRADLLRGVGKADTDGDIRVNDDKDIDTKNDDKADDDVDTALVIRKKSDVINSKVLKGGIISITEYGKQMLERALRGKVSYVKPNTETTPRKIMMGDDLIMGKPGTLKVVYCQMSKHQYLTYLDALKLDINKNINIDISTAIQTIESAENQNEEFTVSKTGSLYKNSSDASTMSYPGKRFGKEGYVNLFSTVRKDINTERDTEESDDTINTEAGVVLTTELKNYSCKLWNLLQNVEKSPGNVFIFSNYVSFGGTSLLRQLFLANGYTQYVSTKRKGGEKGKTFVVFDESATIETRENYRRIFNSPENKNGDIIKVIIGSPIISEGITLKNVRQVHILEPSWNMSRINQTIGRAVRNNSHLDLPIEDWKVETYMYVSVFYTESEVKKGYKTSTTSLSKFFIDREKYVLSEEKDRANKIVERMLKVTAFDCELMRERNMYISENDDDMINGSASCDYTECTYECKMKSKRENNDYDKSTYNLNIQTFDKFDIYYITKCLSELFARYFVWSLDDIVDYIKNSEINISKEAVYATLNYITENKTIFNDMYQRDGFIINRGPYYVFNQVDIDINSSLYSKILDFSIDKTKYTLGEYAKSQLKLDIYSKKEDKKQKIETLPLSDEDVKFNDNIVKNVSVFGTYRQRGTIMEPYGPRDNKFRIVDLRKEKDKTLDQEDKRKVVSGMWIGSYKKPQLLSIAKYLNIQTKVDLEEYDKDELGKLIERHLIKTELVLR